VPTVKSSIFNSLIIGCIVALEVAGGEEDVRGEGGVERVVVSSGVAVGLVLLSPNLKNTTAATTNKTRATIHNLLLDIYFSFRESV
jgi:hypothetical protein